CCYIALSYVWGDNSNGDDASYLLEGKSLPRTIEDSIAMTKSLYYRYLWIDRYCIDQSNAAEKEEQIVQMAQIYEVAQLTLVATAGKDPSYGLPGVQDFTRTMPCEQAGSVLLVPFPDHTPMYDITNSKWANRAWTYQECYFSR
ncbi:heterokaryon incompatibility, partial [Bimuria novae-zelandiae CBS 107.79]